MNNLSDYFSKDTILDIASPPKTTLENFLQGLIIGSPLLTQMQGLYDSAPVQAPTINNAPPVGQSGNVEPLPFFKYQPQVGQDTINFNPRNPDPRITIDEAPFVPKQYTESFNNYNGVRSLYDLDGATLTQLLKFLQ